MKSITRQYLEDIILRQINPTISIHRASKRYVGEFNHSIIATEVELLEFIHSIPYLDNRLKDFIIGHLSEHTIIVSQAWENEFLVKCRTWAESFEWLQGDDRLLSDKHLDELKQQVRFLSLPY